MKNFKNMKPWPNKQGGFIGELFTAAVSYFSGRSSQRRADANQNEANSIRREHLDLARNADDRSQQLFDVYTDNYLPAELDFLKDSQEGLDTDQYVGEASADSRMATAKADERSKRRLNSLGINPGSGKYQGLEHVSKVKSAANEAGAMTSARRYVDKENYDRKGRAVAMGKGLPGAAAGFSGQSMRGLDSVGQQYGADARYNQNRADEAGRLVGESIGGMFDDAEEWLTGSSDMGNLMDI